MISKDVYHFLRIKEISFGRYNIKKDRVQVRTTPSDHRQDSSSKSISCYIHYRYTFSFVVSYVF